MAGTLEKLKALDPKGDVTWSKSDFEKLCSELLKWTEQDTTLVYNELPVTPDGGIRYADFLAWAGRPSGQATAAKCGGYPMETEEAPLAHIRNAARGVALFLSAVLPKMFRQRQLPEQYGTGVNWYDLNIYEDDGLQRNLQHYYKYCIEPGSKLSITTSCFSAWRKVKKANGQAKLIPAIPAGKQSVRLFFFDDNISLALGGSEAAQGICNLRDVETGKYVDFSEGVNGFSAEGWFRYTTVHASSMYNVVLIQANILDAMTNSNYYHDIISKHTQPGERPIVMFDVNGTCLSDDSLATKEPTEMLMATMFSLVNVKPRTEGAEFVWPGKDNIPLDKPTTLRSLVNTITDKDKESYKNFWSRKNCEAFIQKVSGTADLVWTKGEVGLTAESFFKDLDANLDQLMRAPMRDGVPLSLMKCYSELVEKDAHVIFNSFGVDTYRVLKQLSIEMKTVTQVTINYDLWSERDQTAWCKQFE